MQVIKKNALSKFQKSIALVIGLVFVLSTLTPLGVDQKKDTVKASSISIANPHKGYSYNYKGNMHAHSTNSDGSDTPAVVGQWYADHDYDFYTITDHNVLTPNPGIGGILWMGQSEEDSLAGNTAHLNHIGITVPITTGTAQERIDNALAQGGRTVLNHVDRADKLWTPETMESLNNVLAAELMQGGPTDTWDDVLTSGNTLWATANDDSHDAAGRGTRYIIVNSNDASPAASDIIASMNDGNFYPSKGFDLSVSVIGQTISASTTNGNKIKWVKRNGNVIKTTNAQSDSYTVTGSEQYVRIEVLDSSDTAKAWSQPLAVTNTLSSASELSTLVDSHTNPSGYDYWWDYAVPNSATYRDWFFQNVVPANSHVYSMLWDKAIPELWTGQYYYTYFWNTLVPEKTASSYYFDRLWNKAVPELWTGGFYYTRLWDKAVPHDWMSGSSNPYYTVFWNQAVPSLWASSHYYTRLWDKAVPQDWVPEAGPPGDDSYKWTFWIKAVPLSWSGGFYETRFWSKAVPNNWVGSYYTNTLNNSAIPDNWAGGYYASH